MCNSCAQAILRCPTNFCEKRKESNIEFVSIRIEYTNSRRRKITSLNTCVLNNNLFRLLSLLLWKLLPSSNLLSRFTCMMENIALKSQTMPDFYLIFVLFCSFYKNKEQKITYSLCRFVGNLCSWKMKHVTYLLFLSYWDAHNG